ncbi:PadR family transcriptional regulator [Agrilactobacillus fermenti]|uniref:PadR family transcriptional regulator n=1 Tax=Agrilactobacillus fermenti TaxID=2586909 RepID=UPI001E4EB04A|nr:PadR family transcriptional regulator [Agrilactobacillus fermenti]MCD2255567.1 PadR family transcriptional regulator [Agrilactobacillus fermenti]
MAKDISKEMIRGATDGIVLNILSQGDSYGYQMVQQVQQLSHGAYDVNEATLYTVFRRLVKNNLIESYYGSETQGGRRKYYRITPSGVAELDRFRQEWDFAKKIITELVTGALKNDQWNNY